MKVALCSEVLRGWEPARQAAHAAALGYDGLEIAPFTLDAEGPLAVSGATAARIRREVEGEGVLVSGLHWLLVAPEGLSVTDGGAEVERRTREAMLRLVDLCAELGGRYLIHGSPQQRRLPEGDAAPARARAIAHFRAAAERAGGAGVDYLLEPLSPDQTSYVTTLAEAAEVVEAVGHPSFSAMLDTCSAAKAEAEPITDLLARHAGDGLVRHVHFNDPNLRAPGQGDLDFLPIVAALKRAGWDRWIGVEPFDYHPDGPSCAARAIGTIRALEGAA